MNFRCFCSFFIYLYTNTFLNEACFDLNEVVSSSAASLESSMQADKTRECCKTTFSKRVFVLVVTEHFILFVRSGHLHDCQFRIGHRSWINETRLELYTGCHAIVPSKGPSDND